jgi:hypothetical protein
MFIDKLHKEKAKIKLIHTEQVPLCVNKSFISLSVELETISSANKLKLLRKQNRKDVQHCYCYYHYEKSFKLSPHEFTSLFYFILFFIKKV